MVDEIISCLQLETTIKLTDRSFWVTLTSKSNVVEGKIFFPKKITDKLVIFEPGFPGGGSTQFENLWLNRVVESGYSVFLARHSGTIINGKFSENYLNCQKRQKLALETGQKLLGIKKSPTIGDWLIEPKTSIEMFAPHFKEIYLVGHSFGSLAIFFSLLDLSIQQPQLLKQICRFVSLAGTLGRVRSVNDPILTQWQDYLGKQWSKDRVSIGDPIQNTLSLRKVYDRIHAEAGKFPNKVEFVAVTSWGDRERTTDELVHPIESVDIIASLGRGYLILDKTQYSDKKSGRMAHDMENLKSQDLVRFLDKNWLPSQQITVLS